jgi:peptidyl-prolyl cis-trans isomerase SurA
VNIPIFALEVLEKTIAIVNNEPILLSDLKSLDHRLSKAAMIDDLLLFDSSPDSIKKDPKGQLQFLINERIIDSEVKRHNLAVTMERVDQEIRDIAKRNNMSKEDLIKTIQSQGINISEYQDFMKLRIERQSVVEQEVTSKIRLSDEDVLAFYTNSSGKTFVKVNEYTLSHIFFLPEKSGAKEAEQRAQKVLDLINGGASFDSLLSKHTEEENPSNNGFLGTFKTGEFSAEMERAVRDLDIGNTSNVVKSRSGYHIIKLVAKKTIPDPEFEKQRDKYRSLLFERVFKRQFKAWIDLKREEAAIKLN